MTTLPNATAANEQTYNLGTPDYSLADALADFEAEQEAEDVDLMTTEHRQAVNAEMARWFGLD